ncbi:Spindle pole body-associated protein cut12 [Schizosaccharomyces pombe]
MSETLNTPPTYAWVLKAFSSKLAGTVTKPVTKMSSYIEDAESDAELPQDAKEDLRPTETLTPLKSKAAQNGILKTPGTLQIKKTVNFKDISKDAATWNRPTKNNFLFTRLDDENPLMGHEEFKSPLLQSTPKPNINNPDNENKSKHDEFDNRYNININESYKNETKSNQRLGEDVPSKKKYPHSMDAETSKFKWDSNNNNDWSSLMKDCFRDVVNNNRRMKEIIKDVMIDTSQAFPSESLDEPDYTINLDAPRSSSGKYWKQKFSMLDSAHSDLELELTSIRERLESLILEKQEEINFWKQRCRALETEKIHNHQGQQSKYKGKEFVGNRFSQMRELYTAKPSPITTKVVSRPSQSDVREPQEQVPSKNLHRGADMSHLAAQMLTHSSKKSHTTNLIPSEGIISSTPISAASKVRMNLMQSNQTPTPAPFSIAAKKSHLPSKLTFPQDGGSLSSATTLQQLPKARVTPNVLSSLSSNLGKTNPTSVYPSKANVITSADVEKPQVKVATSSRVDYDLKSPNQRTANAKKRLEERRRRRKLKLQELQLNS